MQHSLNTALVSLGFDPVDAIIKDNYSLWFDASVKNGVPSEVASEILVTCGIPTTPASLAIKEGLILDEYSVYKNDESVNSASNDNTFTESLIDYHSEIAFSHGSTGISIQNGVLNYHFGKIVLKVEGFPTGLVNNDKALVEGLGLTVEDKGDLVTLANSALSSSRPLVILLGHQVEDRTDYLAYLMQRQGHEVDIVDYSLISENLNNLGRGYTIATSSLSSFSDFLTQHIKGDKLKADLFAFLWSSSQSVVKIPAVCKSCGVKDEITAKTIPDKGFNVTFGVGRKANYHGCSCCFKGYSGVDSSVEIYTLEDRKLVNVISEVGLKDNSKSELTSVASKFISDGIETMYNIVEKKLQSGVISISDVKKTIL